MTGDCHVRFCENPGVKFPWVTRLCGIKKDAYYKLRKYEDSIFWDFNNDDYFWMRTRL